MKVNVEALNAFFGIDGANWIEGGTFIPLPDNFTFNSEYQRELASKHCKELNQNQGGANNRNAKTWKITYNDGREIVIGGLQRWAVNNGYSRSGVKNLAYGKWKYYKNLISIEEYC
jgi:hypothetical protein